MNHDQFAPSVEIPEELRAQAAALQAGVKPRATVRELLEWVQAERRGFNVVRRVRAILDQLGLVTWPDWHGDTFVGDRVNDVHLADAEKLAARSTANFVR